MPAGLELYNRDGSVSFSTTDRAFKKQGEITIESNASGSFEMPALANSNYIFGYMIRPPDGDTATSSYSPNLSVNGTTVSYSPSNVRFQSLPRRVVLEYGFY